MGKKIKIAVVQMIAVPAPTLERLERADTLIAQAASSGAELVVLPELFNTGYEYSDANYDRAEKLDGQTVVWMKASAKLHNIHLTGSMLLRDNGDIYNAMLLIAPDGRLWRYNKNYPWAWERAYFREGNGVTVADTDLGKLGMLICADVTYPELWAQYQGKIQAMIVSSCPPAVGNLSAIPPDGKNYGYQNTNPYVQEMGRIGEKVFGEFLRRQATHLKVPVVNTTGTGHFRTKMPRPKFSLGYLGLMLPKLFKYWGQADQVEIEAGYYNETYIADAAGKVLQQVPAETEGYAIGEIELPDEPPQPEGKQPPFGLPFLSYMFTWVISRAVTGIYNQHRQKSS